jgi:homogentisate 1,2-dioxygenase
LDLKPGKLDNIMAFMFETRFPQVMSCFGSGPDIQMENRIDDRAGLTKRFDATSQDGWS